MNSIVFWRRKIPVSGRIEDSPYGRHLVRRNIGARCVLTAKGPARNKVTLLPGKPVDIIETDSDPRMPPEKGSKACDWLVLRTDGPRKSLGVELKGRNYGKAIEQLTATLDFAKDHFGIAPAGALVVFKRKHPCLNVTSWRNLQCRFCNSHGPLTIASNGDVLHVCGDLSLKRA